MSISQLSIRLRALRLERGLTLDNLCDQLFERFHISISKDSLVLYEAAGEKPKNPEACMKMKVEYLLCFADFYGVSVDWLLGRPGSVKHGNADVGSVCEYTGLTEEALKSLHEDAHTVGCSYGREYRLRGVLSELFESRFIHDMCVAFEEYSGRIKIAEERENEFNAAYNAAHQTAFDEGDSDMDAYYPVNELKVAELATELVKVAELEAYKRVGVEIRRIQESSVQQNNNEA